MRRSIERLAVAVVLGWSLGCGGTPVFPVKGTVKFDGKPMKGGGAIALVPLTDQPGRMAGGFIQSDGTYELSTHKAGDGSMAGEFRVLINQTTFDEPQATPDGTRAAKATVVVQPEDRIPTVYGDPQASPLTMKVEAKTPNEIDLDLKRK